MVGPFYKLLPLDINHTHQVHLLPDIKVISYLFCLFNCLSLFITNLTHILESNRYDNEKDDHVLQNKSRVDETLIPFGFFVLEFIKVNFVKAKESPTVVDYLEIATCFFNTSRMNILIFITIFWHHGDNIIYRIIFYQIII